MGYHPDIVNLCRQIIIQVISYAYLTLFVIFMVAIVTALDYGFTKLVFALFN